MNQRVNMDINKELWRQIGIKAAETGKQKRELVEEGLEMVLNKKGEKEMTNVNQIIKEVLNGERELQDDLGPEFHEQEFSNGPSEHYIAHGVEGTEIMLYFPEKEFIKDARKLNWIGEISDEALQETLDQVNGLDDKFNYEKVEAYNDEDMNLQWIMEDD